MCMCVCACPVRAQERTIHGFVYMYEGWRGSPPVHLLPEALLVHVATKSNAYCMRCPVKADSPRSSSMMLGRSCFCQCYFHTGLCSLTSQHSAERDLSGWRGLLHTWGVARTLLMCIVYDCMYGMFLLRLPDIHGVYRASTITPDIK